MIYWVLYNSGVIRRAIFGRKVDSTVRWMCGRLRGARACTERVHSHVLSNKLDLVIVKFDNLKVSEYEQSKIYKPILCKVIIVGNTLDLHMI